MTNTMTFDAIEKMLGKHCDTAKCVRDRVEAHKEAVKHADEAFRKFKPEAVNQTRLPFTQPKR